MRISKADYFFYEWLIIEKQMTADKYIQLPPQEIAAIKTEYSDFKNRLRG